MGDSEAPNCLTCSAGMVAGISGVHTGPGATALTRMPRYQVLGKPLGEGDDGALGGGVARARLGLVGFDRGGVDDARAGSHGRDRRLESQNVA